MFRFYVDKNQIDGEFISIIDSFDLNHIRNVLRLKLGESIIICDGNGTDYYCQINKIEKENIISRIIETKKNESELRSKICLFQGIPKKDKMEWIIQKAVELGVYEVIPVTTKRSIVKLESGNKKNKRLERWQTIATAAAKQSNRGIIPKVRDIMSVSQAMEYSKELECKLIPYEEATDINYTRERIQAINNFKSIGIFIGPEGGFEKEEVEESKKHNFFPITLGRRILRTETAGLAILSMVMLQVEAD